MNNRDITYTLCAPISEPNLNINNGDLRISKSGRFYYNYYKKRSIFSFPQGHSYKKAILKRDNYKCVDCESKDDLQVHHKDGNSWEKAGNNANNNLDNLITLCRKCHLGIYHKQHNRPTSKRNKAIIIFCNHGKTYQSIGDIFRISRQRVHQIYSREVAMGKTVAAFSL